MSGCLSLLGEFNILPQILRNQPELLQRRLQILNDLGGDQARFGEAVRILQRVVLEPEDVETSGMSESQTCPRGAPKCAH